MTLKALAQAPADLLAEPRRPEEMRYAELGRYIDAVERSGSDADKLRVIRALKLAVPVTCIVIALFGAPLAMTSYRAGTATGIGISLATTIIFLLLVQLSQALGTGGLVNPTLAAWIPNLIFAVAALGLLVRART
jgi:lipopolysaccharide export system permease protein